MFAAEDFTHSAIELMPYGFQEDCQECAGEAWERMTFGGLHCAPPNLHTVYGETVFYLRSQWPGHIWVVECSS